jgi:hypothetical protein
MKTLSPLGTITDAKDIVEAVLYPTEAHHVSRECCKWAAVRT